MRTDIDGVVDERIFSSVSSLLTFTILIEVTVGT